MNLCGKVSLEMTDSNRKINENVSTCALTEEVRYCVISFAVKYTQKTGMKDVTLTFDLSVAGRTNGGKGNNNYIDRGGNFSDYGWYNLDTGSSGSFNNGVSATFSENDRIGLWVKDNAGDIYTTTKPDKNSADNIIWGKSKIVSGGFSLAGGNFGSNGTKEYYIFKINVEKNRIK